MDKDYFNKWEFKQAVALAKNNPLESKLKYEEYLEKYPKDYSAYPYYSSVLIILGKLDEAEKVLTYVESIYDRDSRFVKMPDKVECLEQNIVYDRLKILSYKKKYNELYKYYLNNSKKIKDANLGGILSYCDKQLGKLELENRENNSYLFKQIIEYKEEDFLDHIKKHLADYNQNLEQPNKNVFSPDFPINEVIEEVKKHIPSDKRMFTGFFEDTYIFKYKECGRDNNKLVDYFKVVCFFDTKEFITMCPVCRYENAPYIDLNYMVRDNDNCKVKKLTQIEKFNNRYKINK